MIYQPFSLETRAPYLACIPPARCCQCQHFHTLHTTCVATATPNTSLIGARTLHEGNQPERLDPRAQVVSEHKLQTGTQREDLGGGGGGGGGGGEQRQLAIFKPVPR